MNDRIQQLQQYAKAMSDQSSEERKYALLVSEAAELIAHDRVDQSLTIEMDIFSAWLLARSRTRESHLLAEAATLLKGASLVRLGENGDRRRDQRERSDARNG